MAQNNNNNDGNGNAHSILRVIQVLTLIPAWAILASVISDYNSNNSQTPGSIQFLFVVAILASVWAFCILITFLRAKNTALWMTFFDVVAMALLIASVIVLSDIANVQCVAVVNQVITPQDVNNSGNTNYYPTDLDPGQKWWNSRLAKRATNDIPVYRSHCSQIKAAWGLAIANIILFFITAILTALIYRQNQQPSSPVIREKFIVEQPLAPQPVAAPPPVFQDPYYGPPRRHSRDHRSHRSHRSHSHRSRNGESHYDGRRGSDYYV